MDDIRDIQDSISELKTQSALAKRTLDSVLTIQGDIVQILTALAVQAEKNKGYDATTKKCDNMNVRIASISTLVGIIATASGKYLLA